jgi:hypothetical protein
MATGCARDERDSEQGWKSRVFDAKKNSLVLEKEY